MSKKEIVFLCDRGARFPLMIIEGLLDTKNIDLNVSKTFYYLGHPILKKIPFNNLKEKLLSCDYIIRVHNQHFVNRKKYDLFMDENNLWDKCIITDFGDSYLIRDKKIYNKCLIYFKRSWLIGKKRKNPPKREKAFPLQFSMLNKYISFFRDYEPEKKYNVLYVTSNKMSKRMHDFNRGVPRVIYNSIPKSLNALNYKTFNRIRKDIRKGFELKTRRFKTYYELLNSKIPNKLIGACTGGSNYDIFYPPENNKWVEYMKLLKRSKILFTACPNNHDGDSRTWEGMSSCALVFLDKTQISTHPFEDGKHVFYFDASSVKSIKKAIEKAKYYLKTENEEERRKIAKAGKKFAIKYHMPKNRIEYIFNCIEKLRKSEL